MVLGPECLKWTGEYRVGAEFEVGSVRDEKFFYVLMEMAMNDRKWNKFKGTYYEAALRTMMWMRQEFQTVQNGQEDIDGV